MVRQRSPANTNRPAKFLRPPPGGSSLAFDPDFHWTINESQTAFPQAPTGVFPRVSA